MVAHGSMRISANLLKTFFSDRVPYRQKCPTTSNSDVRLSCSNQECWRNRPCVASPRAAALLWGKGALIRQRVTEYHNAPPGLTAKYRRKSSIFSPDPLLPLRPAQIPAGPRAVFVYIDVFPGLLVPVAGTESPHSAGIIPISYRFGPIQPSGAALLVSLSQVNLRQTIIRRTLTPAASAPTAKSPAKAESSPANSGP